MLQLCLPAPSWVPHEYVSLFPADAPDSGSKDGKLALLGRFRRLMKEWTPLLRRFLRSEDDQVCWADVLGCAQGHWGLRAEGVAVPSGVCGRGTCPRPHTRMLSLLPLGAPRSCPAQVELLLTMEEFCAEEGVFEPAADAAAGGSGSAACSGAVFAPLFPNLLQLLYDVDVLEEGAITAWAAEKEHADEEDRVFLNKVGWVGFRGLRPEA
jgi:hypothetical protein